MQKSSRAGQGPDDGDGPRAFVGAADGHGQEAAAALEASVAYQLRNTYKCFVHLLQPVLDQHKIPIGMWYYLRVLWEEDGLTQRQISERVGLVAPTTVEQLNNMEKRGLIERRRSLQDRRKVHVHLSAEGAMLKDRLLPFVGFANDVALQGLSPGEIGFLRLVLARMQDNLTRPMGDGVASA